jgi:multicomponent K+:H+ antiporter subunit D
MGGLLAHLPILPVLLPALTAVVLLLSGDGAGAAASQHAQPARRRARAIGFASTVLGLVIAVALAVQADGVAAGGAPWVYRVGDWPPPFGIALVVDRLSALMLVVTWTIAVPVLAYASGGWDAHGRHFHALFQFQLMGLSGAFVTGDVFNLFVFFEVLLIASYALMLHGGGADRFRVGLHYVVLNLVASALFLIGVALVYALTGTLNLAELAVRVPLVTGPDAAVLQAGGLLLLVVFGFKAALMPLAMWMPATYAATSAPVAALFAVMTKVGVYAIVRVHGVVFGAASAEVLAVVQPFLLPVALLTSVVAVLGVLSADTLPRLVAWLTVSSIGTIVAGLGLFNDMAWSAAIFYLANSSIVIAAMFLLSELIAVQRGDIGDRLEPASRVTQPTLLGLMLLLAGASVAGLPPLPGFLGKLMILEASAAHPWVVSVWVVILGVGFLTLIALARAGSILFWNVRADAGGVSGGASPRLVASTLVLLLATVAMTVFAAPLQRYTEAAARQLGDRATYARAVLGGDAGVEPTVRPYRGKAAAP